MTAALAKPSGKYQPVQTARDQEEITGAILELEKLGIIRPAI